mgnify:CR=1 FL=1
MIKDLILLGSTGSIGTSTLSVIRKNKANFKIKLLTTNKNVNKILSQAIEFNVKKVVVFDKNKFERFKNKFKKKRIKVFFTVNEALKNSRRKKAFFTISAISGIEGLEPTLQVIKFTKNLGIANKESIICGWKLLKKELTNQNCNFIPLDSEHFSIWTLMDGENKNNIKKIYLTASGGPFLKNKLNDIKNISPSKALMHPNWKMGKKISIDSATMMNKVFEVIETQRIFDLPKSKIHILIHEKSYVHAIVQFKNGLNKILAHDTSMKIPIFNTIYDNKKFIKTKDLDIRNLNNLNLKIIDKKKFPLIEILKFIPETNSLFETLLVSANDELVNLFLDKKISYINFQKRLKNFIKLKEFRKLRRKKPKNIKEIYALNEYVRLKIKSLCI